jgi:hypothetical protein
MRLANRIRLSFLSGTLGPYCIVCSPNGGHCRYYRASAARGTRRPSPLQRMQYQGDKNGSRWLLQLATHRDEDEGNQDQ